MKRISTGVATVAALLAGGAAASQQQTVTGPDATYWVTADTTSGMMAGMGAPGGRPDLSALMRGMSGGGASARTLTLQLGSSRTAPSPSAEHLPPQGLDAGHSLPLVSPEPTRETAEREYRPESGGWEQPRGRMLIYWGCGERAGPGQPVVIDFANLGAGVKMPGADLALSPQTPPSPGRHAGYGEWPNARARTTVPPHGSLVGEHVVRGNYSDEIRFTLDRSQDFLPPLVLTSNEATGSGAVNLAWNAVDGARGYLATVMGAQEDGETMVMWTSSATAAMGFSIPDHLSPADIRRLVSNRVLMSPDTTQCVVPQEVAGSLSGGMLRMIAYGDEANFSYPPRPSDPRTPWHIDWTVKVRYKSETATMLGMGELEMGGMDSGDEDEVERDPRRDRRQPTGRDVAREVARETLRGVLGGIVR